MYSSLLPSRVHVEYEGKGVGESYKHAFRALNSMPKAINYFLQSGGGAEVVCTSSFFFLRYLFAGEDLPQHQLMISQSRVAPHSLSGWLLQLPAIIINIQPAAEAEA